MTTVDPSGTPTGTVTRDYTLDAARYTDTTRDTTNTTTATTTRTNHYNTPGDSPSWISGPTTTKYTRVLTDLEGLFTGNQQGDTATGTTSIIWRYHNLHGDITWPPTNATSHHPCPRRTL